MKILVLTADPGGPSFRFRVAQYLPALRHLGWGIDVADLCGGLASRMRAIHAARGYDVAWVHRVLLPPFEHLALRAAARRYVFEFDDAILYRDSAARGFESRQRRARFRRMVRGAERVVAGNACLAGLASPDNRNVTVIPTVFDLPEDLVRLSPDPLPQKTGEGEAEGRAPGGRGTIGWMGSRSNLRYLRDLLPTLARVRLPTGVRLLVVSDAALESDGAAGIEVENVRWSLAGEAADLARMDVGIMPLPDDPWTRGKCGTKILQYFAAGLPVVCSPVGVNAELVEHGRNGYMAGSPDEWVAALNELLADPDKRREFGTAGREKVRELYGIERTLQLWREVLGSP